VSRLAAREGKPVADSTRRFLDQGPGKGDDAAWGFDEKEVRTAKQARLASTPSNWKAELPCPVLRLFGSSYRKGRIHVSDAVALVAGTGEQYRVHVAVDRVTGGANEGMLFDNRVLTSPVAFTLTLLVDDPDPDEARWLASSIRSIDRGILRLGSSKAAGRLALAAPPEAAGPHAELFTRIQPCEVNRG
jgi:hypothetical protein